MFVNFNILNQLGSPAINSNTFANRPAAGQTGRLFVSTDTFEIYRDNGTTWDLIGGPGSSTITGTGTATQVAYFTSSQAIGSSANLFWDNTNGRLGIGTNTPGVTIDIHSTGIMAHFNTTSATGNTYIAFQRTGTNVWRLGDQYNAGANFFQIHNTGLSNNAIEINAATNKTIFTALQTYTTGLARGNYFDYNLSVSAGGSFSSPNAITALGASLDLTLAGNATIPSGARSGLDAYNSISFTGTGTLTHNQGAQIRAYSNVTAGWAFNGSATGTITHLAGLRALFPDNTGSAIAITNNYALLLNDQTANTGTVTYTNRWGVYQEGASDLNYFNANTLIGTTTNSGEKLQVNGRVKASDFESIYGTVINRLSWSSTPAGVVGTISNHPVEFYTNGSSKMLLTSSGNLGLGVTPEAWTAFGQVFRLKGSATQGGGALAASGNANFRMFANTYYDGSYRYIGNGTATQYEQDGYHSWYLAASGTAGNAITFTQAMTLTSGGYLLLGTTTSNYGTAGRGTFEMNGSVDNILAQKINNVLANYIYSNSVYSEIYSTNPLLLAVNGQERARITTGGNVLINTTTDGGQKLQVSGDINVYNSINGGILTSASGKTFIASSGETELYLRHTVVSGVTTAIANFANVTTGDSMIFYGQVRADGTNTLVQLGDITAYGNGTLFSVDDASSTISTSSSNIDFNGLTSSVSAGSLVGYITIKLNGTAYKMPYYNL